MPWSHHDALHSDTIHPEIPITVLSSWCHPLWGHPPWHHLLCCLYDDVIHQDDFIPQWCLYHDAFAVTLSTNDAICHNVFHYHGYAIHQDAIALMTLPGCNLSWCLHHTIYHSASAMTSSAWYNSSGYIQYYSVYYDDFPWCHIPWCLHQGRFTKRVPFTVTPSIMTLLSMRPTIIFPSSFWLPHDAIYLEDTYHDATMQPLLEQNR